MDINLKIAVIGAGPIGLSTALAIQENIPRSQVTVIAERFSPDTTGDVAAGIILANLLRLIGTPPALVKKMFQDSFSYFDKILNSPEAMTAGVSKVSGYIMYREGVPKEIIYGDVVYCCQPCTENELKSIPGNFKHGIFVTTLQVECRRYLPWLLERIKKNGGKIIKGKVKELKELFGQYDIIVNCAALGNAQLTGDKAIIPVRGQTIRVSAPGIRHFYCDYDGHADVIPCYDTVHLGSTFQRNDSDTTIRPDERERIMNNCKKLVPALEGATFIRDGVGLRPWREPIKIEAEQIQYGTTAQQVVHSYGYSSSGVALSWGAALHTTELVKQILHRASHSAKL